MNPGNRARIMRMVETMILAMRYIQHAGKPCPYCKRPM